MPREEYWGVPGIRIANVGANVSEWSERTGEGSSTWDICKRHIPTLEKLPYAYDDILVPYVDREEPSGEDGREGDVAHPPYEEMDEADRKCAICGHDLIDD